jgi:hypothetical protein
VVLGFEFQNKRVEQALLGGGMVPMGGKRTWRKDVGG